MKPENWDSLSEEEKIKIAKNLLNSMRGNYIVSQALYKAIEIMKKEKYPETSNIEDMEMLRETFFRIFTDFEKMEKKKC